jgi:hypothetical protein
MKPEFVFDALAVGLDGFDTQMQVTGNLARPHPVTQSLEDFEFPI